LGAVWVCGVYVAEFDSLWNYEHGAGDGSVECDMGEFADSGRGILGVQDQSAIDKDSPRAKE